MHALFSRRRLLHAATASTGGLLVTPSVLAQASARATVAEIMGPFYPVQRPLDEDADLTRVDGVPGTAQGRVFDLQGQIINLQGQPVADADIDMWQANTHGRYAHASDPNTGAPLDPAFQGFSRQQTDSAGRFRFLTIVPGPYPVIGEDTPWTRTPHIHFDIRGRHDRLVTQIYFAGHPLNATDQLYQALSPADRETVTLQLQPATAGSPAAEVGHWRVVLASG